MRAAPRLRRTLVRGLLAAVWLVLTPAAHAQRSDPESVSFATREASGVTVQLRGLLWQPTASSRGVVVLVHGSGGLRDHPVGHYARAFSAAGYTVLAIDAFTPRGIADTVDDQSRIGALQMTRDSFAALQFLGQRGLDTTRAAIMGFSKGGTAALYAGDRNFLPRQVQRFRAVLAFYPSCSLRPRTPKPVGAMFVALGAEDDYVGNQPCIDYVADIQRAGGDATVTVYPGAAHAFDGHPDLTKVIHLRRAENYSKCNLVLEDDGRFAYRGASYAPGDPALAAELRRTCMTRGATVGTNPAQKAAATRDALAFLERALAR